MIKKACELVIFVLSILFVGGLTACSGGLDNSSSSAEPPLGEIKTITDKSQITRPIDKYLPTVDEIMAAQDILANKMNQCFAQHGISSNYSFYKDKEFAKKNIFEPDRDLTKGFWKFFNPKTAAKWGPFNGPNANTIYIDPNDSKYVTKGYPVKENSEVGKVCITDLINAAPNSSDGLFNEWLGLSNMPDGGPITPSSDTRFLAVQQKWSDCMRQKGYNFDAVDNIYTEFLKDKSVSEKAKATAVADVQCKIQTNLVGVAVAVQSVYDEQYIDSHREALAAWRQTLDDYIAGK
ncbi:MAG: hypothetical protein LBT99_01270 [Bifidobacteriaceae bacterium]|jgi:hypothetical protein|nr:hypothetical protein [Bifidobacteriaceae bacterium]